MIDIKQLLYKITENEEIFDENIDLLESGILEVMMFRGLF